MAATFLHTASTATFQDNAPNLTVGAISAGSNRKLCVVLAARSTNFSAWSVSTFTIGGQTYDQAYTTPIAGTNLGLKVFVWHEATIAAMSGTAVSWTDTPFISGIYCSYFVVQDCDQANVAIAQNGAASDADTLQITTSGNTATDLLVCTIAISDNPPAVTNWDNFTEIAAATADDGSSLSVGMASASITDTTHDFVTSGVSQNINGIIIRFVTSDVGVTPTVSTAGPVVPSVIFDNELRVSITGTDFKATQVTATVTLNDTNPLTTTPTTTVTQTAIRSWADTAIVFDVDKGALASNSVWLAVTNDDGNTGVANITVYDDPGTSGVGVRLDPVPDRTIVKDTAFSFDASLYLFASDAQDTLTYTVDALPGGLSLNPTTGVVSGTISDGQAVSSPFTCTFTATDEDSNAVNDGVTWTVAEPSITAAIDVSKLTRPEDGEVRAFIVAHGGPFGGSIDDDMRRALVIELSASDFNEASIGDLWKKYIESL